MVVNSYYGIYQAERGKTAAEIRMAEAQLGGLATVGWPDATGLALELPCTRAPELFFAESPRDVELAKAMCRGCRARLACLAGALERREPLGVWGGELLMNGAIVPQKRARGRPRKDATVIGASA
jgi:WhiB family transcriptional regulator, redox-sensing transcriptional regulator